MSSSSESLDGISTKTAEDQEPLRLEKRLLTPFLNKKIPPVPTEDERKEYPFRKANPLSKIFFTWLFPLMKVGYKRTLQSQDLWYLDEKSKVQYYYEIFKRNLEREVMKPKLAQDKLIVAKKAEGTYDSEYDDEFVYPKYALIKAMLRTFWIELLFAAIFVNLSNIISVLNPLIIKALITYVERKTLGVSESTGKGVGYAIGVSLMLLVQGICINHAFHCSMMIGAKCKALLTKALLEKSFKMNAVALHKFPGGKITSLMSTDLSRLDFAIGFQVLLLGFAVPAVVSILMLIVNVGVSALTGIGVFLLSVALIGGIARYFTVFRKKIVKHTDTRVGYMKELLSDMKIIKYYSWEEAYSKTVADVRKKEMGYIFKLQVLRSIVITIAISLPQIGSMVTFLCMYSISNLKDPANVFSSLTYFNVLAEIFFLLPLVVATAADMLISLTRVSEVLQSGEINLEEKDQIHENVEELQKNGLAIKTVNANFEWKIFALDEEEEGDENRIPEIPSEASDKNKVEETKSIGIVSDEISISSPIFKGLTDINLEIKKGEFVAVTGIIGSGKSSLLNAMAGFMHKLSGDLKVDGSLLLCGQPWVQNTTIKENILFGEEYDEKKYQELIYACSLDADLEILPAGDKTEIGERGITLSGGQKLRINLARAIYANRDIILLDDVLSAVDARVGKHIVEECIMGLLGNKTRILATHQLSLIGSANRVIFLNGDGSIDVGTVEELKARNGGFANLMSYNSDSKKEKAENDEEIDEEVAEDEKLLISQTTQDDQNMKHTVDGTLMTKEERAVNEIKFSVYRRYVSMGSGIFKFTLVPLYLLMATLATFCQLFTNNWLSFWTQQKFDRSPAFYMGIYIMITFTGVFLMAIQLMMITYVTNNAARALNIRAVERVLKLPMSLFDTTPIGRILNRFTKDTDALDNEMNEQFSNLMFPLCNVVGVLIMCIIYLPWFAIAIPPLLFIFIAMAGFYQASGREIKRLELVQRSFVYNNFNESLTGTSTIRAYSLENRFIEKNNNLTNKMNEAYFITIANQRWLGIHLQIIGSLFCFLIAILSITRVFNLGPSSVGLLLSYILDVGGQLTMLMRSLTQVENEMNSVERLCYYAFDLVQELPYAISETKPRPEWPEQGVIDFKNVSMSYRPGLPLVLKDLNMHIGGGEKIGICGRTGAGKSSIMTALFRLSEISNGSIIIDGIDIRKIGLHDLRSKLSIIPQDPVLFRGNIRRNLDPFNEHPDDWLWESLKKSGLIEDVAAVKSQTTEMHKFHLDQAVDNDGINFSLGERQLIALARAVVRDSKILILDEATSSVDYETDAKIQSAIAREFKDCTILCIAHRLKTILDYDKILVLDRGEIQQYDSPWNLFNQEGGIFQSMCKGSNINSDDFAKISK